MYEKTVAEPRLTAGFSAAQPPGVGAAAVSDLRMVPGERVDDLVPGGDRGTGRDDAGTPPALAAVCDLLSERYGVDFDSIWVNLYRDGADSVAWHGDRNGRTQQHPFVVTISLGGRRLFQLRPKGTTTVTHRFRPGLGDLLVMGGACQHDWEHSRPQDEAPGAAADVRDDPALEGHGDPGGDPPGVGVVTTRPASGRAGPLTGAGRPSGPGSARARCGRCRSPAASCSRARSPSAPSGRRPRRGR